MREERIAEDKQREKEKIIGKERERKEKMRVDRGRGKVNRR